MRSSRRSAATSCVWKPSPKAPLSRGRGAEASSTACCERQGLPGIFQLFISAGTELAEKFVDDRRVDLVSFTGSTAVGRKVGERVAARLGKSLLELGGNNAIIVDEFANLDLAVPSIVFGAVGTAGQRCTSTRRVFVHESRSKELEQRLLKAYAQVRIGDPLEAGHADGPADRRALRSSATARRSRRRSAPAAQCCAATRCARPGNFVEPTIVRARGDWEIVQTETFAPILYLIEFESLDEAIAMHNAVASRPVVGDLHRQPAARRAVPVGGRQRLRHRQRQHRHLRRRDRRRIRRREGHRRRPRVRLGQLEGVHAPPDEHDQLEPRAAAGSGHRLQGRALRP